MRILFMGTPEFAVASLRCLVEEGHTICGVLTQPDKPRNRGHKVTFSPVKEYALSQSLPCTSPPRLRDGDGLELVKGLAPELTVVAAYGKLLPEEILAVPPLGSINVHSSCCPSTGRRPDPVSVINGEAETGITTMYMGEGLDTGDILLVQRTPIGPEETAGELFDRLAPMGADCLKKTVRALEEKRITPVKQDEQKATYAPMLDKTMAELDFTRPAAELSSSA